MPRKPNYKMERLERDRIKAAKKAARLAEQQEKRLQPDDENPSSEKEDS